MKKLSEDFGVSALVCVLIIVGVFTLIGIGLFKDMVTFADLLPLFGAWVGAVISAYLVVKGVKTGSNH